MKIVKYSTNLFYKKILILKSPDFCPYDNNDTRYEIKYEYFYNTKPINIIFAYIFTDRIL